MQSNSEKPVLQTIVQRHYLTPSTMDSTVIIRSIFFQREKVQMKSCIFLCEHIQNYQSESPNSSSVARCDIWLHESKRRWGVYEGTADAFGYTDVLVEKMTPSI